MWAGLQLNLMLPFSIAGLGLREAGLVGMSTLIDVPVAVGLAWSLTIFFGNFLAAAAGGLIESRDVDDRVLRARRLRHGCDGAQNASDAR